MNLDFPRFDVGVRSAALWRVAARRVGKPRGKLNKIFYVSSRLDVLAASRDFNVGVGVCVGVGV
ncbi:MAG: hypothetical protein J6K20_07655 [Thermoguttaceae bacterium]|nr:hypothetical protein [Thermoguttaceae bacterium]